MHQQNFSADKNGRAPSSSADFSAMERLYYPVAHRSDEEYTSFATRYQDFDTSVITPIFQEKLGQTVKRIEPSTSWGTSHVIYRVETDKGMLIFRANLGINPTPEYMMLVEKLLTDEVAAAGVPTNRVLTADISRGQYPFDYQIEAVMAGQDLEKDFSGTQAEYDQLSYTLGVHLAHLHQIPVSGTMYGRFSAVAAQKGTLDGAQTTFAEYLLLCVEEDCDQLVSRQVVTAQQGKEIAHILHIEAAGLTNIPRAIVHHDLADHNIFYAGTEITALFDWEAAIIGDPLLDLASCPTWRTHYPREAQLLAGYESVTQLPSDWPDRRSLYLLRTMLWKMVFALRAGIMNEQRRERFFKVLAHYNIT